MHKPRLETLADSIFAIVMTLLVIDIKVPIIYDGVTNTKLAAQLLTLTPLFVSYILSFTILSTYWMAHHFMISLMAKNVTRNLLHLNIPFLMCVALVPFSSHFLGYYHNTEIGIAVFGVNVVLIGIFLLLILRHIITTKDVETSEDFTERDFHVAFIRTLLPPTAAVVAIVVSFASTSISLLLFIVAIILNLIPQTLRFLLDKFGRFARP